MNTFFCRAFQCCFAVGARFLPWRTPEVFSGEGSLLRAADILRENALRRPFVIASRRQCADEHFRALQEKLDEQDILLSIFSSVEPNPSVETVEKIAAQYKIDSCDCFLVIGGGSPMDAAKAAAARLARPDKPLSQLVGLLKVRRRIPPLIAVPTTAGTGSETTIAAVVTGSDHHKYAISDLCLIPRYAILDPALTVGLPPHITAETGMDALTHAVEAYLSRFYKRSRRACSRNMPSSPSSRIWSARTVTARRSPTARRCCRPRSTQARRSRAQASVTCTPSRIRSAGSTAYPMALQTRCFSLSCSKITAKRPVRALRALPHSSASRARAKNLSPRRLLPKSAR